MINARRTSPVCLEQSFGIEMGNLHFLSLLQGNGGNLTCIPKSRVPACSVAPCRDLANHLLVAKRPQIFNVPVSRTQPLSSPRRLLLSTIWHGFLMHDDSRSQRAGHRMLKIAREKRNVNIHSAIWCTSGTLTEALHLHCKACMLRSTPATDR